MLVQTHLMSDALNTMDKAPLSTLILSVQFTSFSFSPFILIANNWYRVHQYFIMRTSVRRTVTSRGTAVPTAYAPLLVLCPKTRRHQQMTDSQIFLRIWKMSLLVMLFATSSRRLLQLSGFSWTSLFTSSYLDNFEVLMIYIPRIFFPLSSPCYDSGRFLQDHSQSYGETAFKTF